MPMTIYKIRLKNARKIACELRTLAEFADKLGRAPTQVSRFMGKNPSKMIGDKLARDIETAFNLPHGWMDEPHNGTPALSQDNTLTEDEAAMLELWGHMSEKDKEIMLEMAKRLAEDNK